MNSKIKKHGLFLLGIALCFAVAAVASLVEELIPGGLLGASIIALFYGYDHKQFFSSCVVKAGAQIHLKKGTEGCHCPAWRFPFGWHDPVGG